MTTVVYRLLPNELTMEIEGDQKKELEKRSGERNVDSTIQVQLEEDGGGSTR